MEKILEVKDLVISFRTNNGNVRAVRNISFDLEKGETLAIVGESGSGKSVTARAIMGIEAMNAINEGGEIFFDGKDLLKIDEEDFHQLRGNRVAMVFQDPLSSLNPIMRIGQQLTEAMILNGKANQRDAKRELKERLPILEKNMAEALGASGTPDAAAYAKKQIDTLRRFVRIGSEQERVYDDAYSAAETAKGDLEGLKIDMLSAEPARVVRKLAEIRKELKAARHPFVIGSDNKAISGAEAELGTVIPEYEKTGGKEKLAAVLDRLIASLEPVLGAEKPDWFSVGYLLMREPSLRIDSIGVSELNLRSRRYLEEQFLAQFRDDVCKAIRFSRERAEEARGRAVGILDEAIAFFGRDDFSAADAKTQAGKCTAAVEEGIDRLEIRKDSLAWTFRRAMDTAVERYERGLKLDRTKQITRGAKMEKELVDLPLLRRNLKNNCLRVRESYAARRDHAPADQDDIRTEEIIARIRECSAKMVYKVTRGMANNRAVSLMEEVGIPEARKRLRQYPHEFSGGMRQRIVIAIALAANPDILICDEPTTALDVTIQAQILELINRLKRERNLSIIFITHDLGVVANMADKIAVMYAGKIVEYGTSEEVFYEPAHPYTWALLASMPDLETREKLDAIPGTPPNMIMPPKGDAFAARNRYAMQIDLEQQPPAFEITPTHWAATWLLHPDAPKVDPPAIVQERIARMRARQARKEGGTEA